MKKPKLFQSMFFMVGAFIVLFGTITPELRASSPLSVVNDDNESLTDVVAAFENINPHGIDHPINRNGLVQISYDGSNTSNDHLQSVQRLKDNYFAVSGSNNEQAGGKYGSTLFIVEFVNNRARVFKELYPASARQYPDNPATDPANEHFWHAGGMALLGDILAVPLESSNGESLIVFYDVSNPRNPIRQTQVINRHYDNHRNFGALIGITAGWVMMTKLETGHYLLGVWSDNYGLDLYKSSQADQFAFDENVFTTICHTGYKEDESYFPYCDNDFAHRLHDAFDLNISLLYTNQYQNMSIVKQQNESAFNEIETKYYAIGTYNDGAAGFPTSSQKDMAHLYEFVPGESLAESTFTRVAEKHMFCSLCNFDAGAGVYVSDNTLKMYGVGHTSSGTNSRDLLPFEAFLSDQDNINNYICDQKVNTWGKRYMEPEQVGVGVSSFAIGDVETCGEKDALVVAVSYRIDDSNEADFPDLRISDVSYGSSELHKIDCSPDQAFGYVTELWYFVNPTETNADVIINWEKNGVAEPVYDIVAQSISLKNVYVSFLWDTIAQIECNIGLLGNNPILNLAYEEDQIYLGVATTFADFTNGGNELIPFDGYINTELWQENTFNTLSVGALNINRDIYDPLVNFEWEIAYAWPWSAIGIGLRVNPPLPVNDPFPPANGGLQLIDVDLTWDTAVSPNGPSVTYDVYLGTDPSSLVQISADQTETSLVLDDLFYDTSYYWRVDVIDDQGNIIEGEIWEFTTVPANLLTVGYYEETDPRFTYNGTQPWLPWYGSKASRGSIVYTNEYNASMTFDFYGEGMTIYRNVQTGQGDMQVCIDGQCTTVSNYNPNPLWQSPVSFTGLGLGVHQVEIKNVSAQLSLDAVEIINPQPLGTGMHENDNPNIVYSGRWIEWFATLPSQTPSQGSGTYVLEAGATAEFWIEGDEIVLYRTVGYGWGSFEVCIDDTPCTLVPNTAASTYFKQPYPFANLGNGVHHVVIRTTSAATVDIDAIEVLSENGSLKAGLHQESSELIEFVGAWQSYSDAGVNGGVEMYTNDLDAEIRFSVEGDQFVFLRSTGPNRGNFDVCIDGDCVTRSSFSFNGQYLLNQPMVFDSLGSGTHDVVIKNAASSTNYYLFFDAILIPEPLTTGVHQENNTNFLYYGHWGRWVDTVHIERYTADNSARVEFTFMGDGLILRQATYPQGTPITVCVDGADCTSGGGYSAAVTWDVPIMLTNLGMGLHHVRVYPSTSTPWDQINIVFDEIEILGSSIPLLPGNTYNPYYDAHFLHDGYWSMLGGSQYRGNSLFYNDDVGAAVIFNFEGDALDLYYTKAPWSGMLSVCIDDNPCQMVDQYDPVTTSQMVRSFSDLGEGLHQVTLRNNSIEIFTANKFVNIEAIEVRSTP